MVAHRDAGTWACTMWGQESMAGGKGGRVRGCCEQRGEGEHRWCLALGVGGQHGMNHPVSCLGVISRPCFGGR